MNLLSLSPDLEMLLRLGLAVICGMAVGLNRAHHGQLPHPNRVRVHVLVGLSACLVVLAAGPGSAERSRAIQGVATGVGFLGAGEILVAPPRGRNQPPEVHGLSSAASIWFTATLGVTVATARPALVLVALLLALITLSDRHRGSEGEKNAADNRSQPGQTGIEPGSQQSSFARRDQKGEDNLPRNKKNVSVLPEGSGDGEQVPATDRSLDA